MVVLGVAMVYGIRFEFQPSTTSKPSSESTGGQTNSYPLGGGGLVISALSYVLVFAYDGSGEGFVQASIALTGPLVNGTEMENQTLFSNGTAYYVNSFNGTTTTDLQNPLILQLFPAGVYVLSATYGSASPQSLTLNVTGFGSWYPAVFDFGSSPPPPMGYLLSDAFAENNGVGSFVPASVTITGPESINATVDEGNYWGPTVFTLAPGAYTITATYELFPQQTDTANVTDGGFAGAFFCFGCLAPIP
jgi:hypothetical protein